MNAAQQTINCRISALEAGQREVSAQHSAIEAELSELRESVNQTERELSELATEIGRVSSMSATAREMLSRRADEADERFTRSERGSAGLSWVVEALRRRCDDAHEKTTANKDDISKIKKDPKQVKDRVDQQQPTPPPAPPAPTAALGFDSLIVSEYPPLFEEFRAKRFNLLWQGSRDGFIAREFHCRCDGRANTLMLILNTDGNVFGGFTAVKWENNCSYKGDDNLRNFLFTLRNPHRVPRGKSR
jgi:hypothetical protein